MRKRRLPILLVDGSSIEQKVNLKLINHLLAALSTKLISRSRNKACFHFSLFISYFINSNIRLRFLLFQTNEILPSEGDETDSSQICFFMDQEDAFYCLSLSFFSRCVYKWRKQVNCLLNVGQ